MGPRQLDGRSKTSNEPSLLRVRKGCRARSGIAAAWDSKFASLLELADVRHSGQMVVFALSHPYDWSDSRIDYL